ncbi:MAG: ATP-binding protein [Ignisphaera sp.]
MIFEKVNKTVKLRFTSNDNEAYLALAELVVFDNDYSTEFINSIDSLSNRSIKNGFTYILLTCMNSQSLSTKIGVICKSPEESQKELEIVCSILESVSQGLIKCYQVEDVTSVINNCFTIQSISPINFLIQILRRSHSKKQNHDILLHPIPTTPFYNLYTVRDYQYLSSVFSRGSIPIGHLYSNPNLKAALSDDHILRHILVVGSTGSGKTTTASILAEKVAEKGYAIIIVDWHGEYRFLLQNNKNYVIYTNPLKGVIPEPLSLEELIKREPLSFVEILESSLELTPAQAHILEDAVNILAQKITGHGYYIDIIIDVIQNSSASARWFAESRESLLRKLKPLSSTYLNIQWNKLSKISISKGQICIFDVSFIPNVRVRRIISSLLIRSIILKAQYNNMIKPILVVVDEAHNIFHTESPLSTLIAEVRKWFVGFTIITQAPSMLAPVVIKNTNTKIIHALKSSSDIDAVVSAAILKKEHKKIVSALKPGEAFLVIPELAEPILIKISRV